MEAEIISFDLPRKYIHSIFVIVCLYITAKISYWGK